MMKVLVEFVDGDCDKIFVHCGEDFSEYERCQDRRSNLKVYETMPQALDYMFSIPGVEVLRFKGYCMELVKGRVFDWNDLLPQIFDKLEKLFSKKIERLSDHGFEFYCFCNNEEAKKWYKVYHDELFEIINKIRICES